MHKNTDHTILLHVLGGMEITEGNRNSSYKNYVWCAYNACLCFTLPWTQARRGEHCLKTLHTKLTNHRLLGLKVTVGIYNRAPETCKKMLERVWVIWTFKNTQVYWRIWKGNVTTKKHTENILIFRLGLTPTFRAWVLNELPDSEPICIDWRRCLLLPL